MEADQEGNVQLVLNLNVHDLMRILDKNPATAGEATTNPIPRNVTLLKNVPDLCDKVPHLRYLIYIHSSPGNRVKRDLVRRTWASTKLFKKQVTQVVFFVGHSADRNVEEELKAEARVTGDIVQGDFLDNYKNLTLKGVMGLNWVAKYCSKAAFNIKTDDDAFINIFGLLKFLERQDPDSNLLACPLWNENSMPILRDPATCAKWCVKYDEFPGQKYFPQYCAGLIFVLSRAVVPRMVQAARTTPFFWIDDVYITGLLPPKVSNMQYVTLLDKFTVKQPIALAQYNNTNADIQYLFVHGKVPEISIATWEWLLARLPQADVDTLSEDFVDQVMEYRRKLKLGFRGR